MKVAVEAINILPLAGLTFQTAPQGFFNPSRRSSFWISSSNALVAWSAICVALPVCVVDQRTSPLALTSRNVIGPAAVPADVGASFKATSASSIFSVTVSLRLAFNRSISPWRSC